MLPERVLGQGSVNTVPGGSSWIGGIADKSLNLHCGKQCPVIFQACLMRLKKAPGGVRLSRHFCFSLCGNSEKMVFSVGKGIAGVSRNVYSESDLAGMLCRSNFLLTGENWVTCASSIHLLKPMSSPNTILKPSRQSFDAFKDWYGMCRNILSEGK